MCIFELSLKLGLDASEKWYTILRNTQDMCKAWIWLCTRGRL